MRDWDVNIYRGVLTGLNEAFIIDTQTRDRILASCRSEEERKRTEDIIKPVLKGRDIGRYCYKSPKQYTILAHKQVNVNELESLKNHLLQYKSKLLERAGQQNWWMLQSASSLKKIQELGKEKIGYSDMGYRFALIDGQIFK